MEYDMIFSYTRANAIEDGVLVDISNAAKEAGFRVPVAVTCAVWNQYIEWAEDDSDRQTIQHQSGRLWDILWMLSLACRRCPADRSELLFRLRVIPRDARSKRRTPKLITLKSVCGGGDSGEPVITVMMPDED